jgi:hypothetical protein
VHSLHGGSFGEPEAIRSRRLTTQRLVRPVASAASGLPLLLLPADLHEGEAEAANYLDEDSGPVWPIEFAIW